MNKIWEILPELSNVLKEMKMTLIGNTYVVTGKQLIRAWSLTEEFIRTMNDYLLLVRKTIH